MPAAISSNTIKCQSAMTGKPVEAVVVVYADGSSRVLCPAEKGCRTAGLCSYEQLSEIPPELAMVAAPEEMDPIGSVQRLDITSGGADRAAERDVIGSVEREETPPHITTDEEIFF